MQETAERGEDCESEPSKKHYKQGLMQGNDGYESCCCVFQVPQNCLLKGLFKEACLQQCAVHSDDKQKD